MIVIESGGAIFLLSRMSVLPNNVGRGHEDSDNNVRADPPEVEHVLACPSSELLCHEVGDLVRKGWLRGTLPESLLLLRASIMICYILLIWKSLKLNYVVALVVIYCGWWLAKLVVQKEEFFGFIGF